MRIFLDYLSRYTQKRLVRPWALSAPILVLLVSLPLLRPVRHPDPRGISSEESARLATVQAIVEHHTLAIDNTDFSTTGRRVERPDGRGHDRRYSDQPPMMSALLSGAYWVMRLNGLTFKANAPAVIYLLTLLGVTVPVACAAGLIYRMGRLFELRRPWRALLAASTVLGTGLVSYATVLNPHAPAAALVLASAACLVHLTLIHRPSTAPIWLFAAGLCAALAATIDPSALPFLFLFLAVTASLRRSPWRRLGGVLIYALGALGPILVHGALTVPATRDVWQGAMQGSGFRVQGSAKSADRVAVASPSSLNPEPSSSLSSTLRLRPEGSLRAEGRTLNPSVDDEEDDDQPQTNWQAAGRALSRFWSALLGDHGVLSHFPVLLLGVVGVSMIMHRHWPGAAKVLASSTVAGALFLLIAYSVHLKDPHQWRDAMFAARWFIVFGPLLLFWAGAWLRRPHRPAAWALAGVLLAFSVTVSILGATGPLPKEGFVRDGADRYTAAEALSNLLHPPEKADQPTAIADRR